MTKSKIPCFQSNDPDFINSSTSPITSENATALIKIKCAGIVNGTNIAIKPKKSSCFVNVLPSKSPIPTSSCPDAFERKITIKSGICAPIPKMTTDTINVDKCNRFDNSTTPKISHRELNRSAANAIRNTSPSFHNFENCTRSCKPLPLSSFLKTKNKYAQYAATKNTPSRRESVPSATSI